MATLVTIVSLFVVFGCVQSANIVAVVPSPYHSHQVTFRPLWRELARRGHKLTLLTTDTMERNENITQIDLSETYKINFEKHKIHELLKKNIPPLEFLSTIFNLLDDQYRYQLTHPDVVKLIQTKTKIDLLFIEGPFPVWPVLSTIWNCPFIGVTSMDALMIVHEYAGNSIHPAIYRGMQFEEDDSFVGRLKSTLVVVTFSLVSRFLFPVLGNSVARRYIGEGLPDIMEVQRNASLIFSSANPIFYPPRPVTPITINLEGRLHLTEPKKLPEDLQDYLDRSTHGCIYMSFGTTVNSDYFKPETIEVFRKTFEKLDPIRVLWKFDNISFPDKPKNIEIRKWLPQHDILRHPNVKMFITQGGLQSLEETIDSGVPILGMPFFGDQISNVNSMVRKQIGLRLDTHSVNEDTLTHAISEILGNPMYKNNIEKISALLRDQPMTALEKAVWWTEYVLRHGGTEHLRSPSADIPLYQYFYLDIMAFIIFILFCIILLFNYVFKGMRFLYRKLFVKKNKEKFN